MAVKTATTDKLICVYPPPSDRLHYQHYQHQLLLYIEEVLRLPTSSAAICAAAKP